jgi:lysophospholipase L1-like esterase
MRPLTRSLLYLFCLLSLSFCLSSGFAQTFDQWETSIANIEKQAPKPPVKGRKYIVFTGSSSIVFWKSLADDFPNKKVLNHGFGGSQTFEVLHFADRIITPYKPKQVVVYSGDNDLAAGKSPEAVLRDFRTLFNTIRLSNPKTFITFISIKPSPSRRHLMPAMVKTNKLVHDFLAEQKKTSFIDVYTPMLLPNGNPRPELFKSDSLHMVPAGYKLWAEIVRPYLR